MTDVTTISNSDRTRAFNCQPHYEPTTTDRPQWARHDTSVRQQMPRLVLVLVIIALSAIISATQQLKSHIDPGPYITTVQICVRYKRALQQVPHVHAASRCRCNTIPTFYAFTPIVAHPLACTCTSSSSRPAIAQWLYTASRRHTFPSSPWRLANNTIVDLCSRG